ncbi:uncharacterized protein LOC134216876 [Armigeres subalbatus]|uniref:uncharacterized protein LOC134216876 n=1 Tax=Armigeres subalbatus TaxID=124917 RepID=UPI002ED48F06
MLKLSQLNPIGGQLSNYAKALPKTTPNVQGRYLEKIRIIGYNDPYSPSFFAQGTQSIPTTVTTGHVIDYLLNFISSYTGRPMKNARSVEGYRKFEAGFVPSLQGTMREGYHVLVGKVILSMKLKENMLRPWIIIDVRGNIIYAHCTCVAGITETCSHVSAVLYALANLHAQSINHKLTVTDFPCYWRQPTKNVRTDLYKKVRNIGYGKASKYYYDTISGKTRRDFDAMLRKLNENEEQSVLLNTICDGVKFTCQNCQNNYVPDELIINRNVLLQGNFSDAFRGKKLDDLREVGRGLKFTLTESDVVAVEKLTRKQASCSFW